jgi:hypothetical protein
MLFSDMLPRMPLEAAAAAKRSERCEGSMLKKLFIAAAVAAIVASSGAALAQEKHEAPAKAFAEGKLKQWMSEPVVIDAIKAQNAKHASLEQAKIDELDKQWRAETKSASKPLIEQHLGNPLSAYLKKLKADTKGLVTEIFVMDDKGLNVGQSDVTSDYWQGDEAKWQKTFLVGPSAVFIDKIEKDESSQAFQSQISMAIADPATGKAIGAVTVGVDVDELLAQ